MSKQVCTGWNLKVKYVQQIVRENCKKYYYAILSFFILSSTCRIFPFIAFMFSVKPFFKKNHEEKHRKKLSVNEMSIKIFFER